MLTIATLFLTFAIIECETDLEFVFFFACKCFIKFINDERAVDEKLSGDHRHFFVVIRFNDFNAI